MATTLADIQPHIIQTHILRRLDGQSLSTIATVSSYLQALCSEHNLWSHISKSTWPSITHPRVDDIISAFPAGHRSFFQDSFPALITEDNHRNRRRSSWSNSQQSDRPSSHLDHSSYPWPSELISTVDIRYQNDTIYSRVEFTNITTDFLSSALQIKLPGSKYVHRIPQSFDLKVDDLPGTDEATLSHLKESMTLNWIIIHPTLKRACNLSSIKPVGAKQDSMTNEILLQYVTVLPGCDPNEMVQCRIQVVLGVATGSVGLHLKEVILKLKDLDSGCLNGRDFLVTTQGAILERNNVRRKLVDDEGRLKSHKEFKKMKREKKERVKKEEQKREFAVKMRYVGILVLFFIDVYFLILLIQ